MRRAGKRMVFGCWIGCYSADLLCFQQSEINKKPNLTEIKEKRN